MTARPLRIGITCYPTFGGSGIVATEIGLELARRGHQVHFIAAALPVRLDGSAEVRFHPVTQPDYPLLYEGQYPLALASRMVEVAEAETLDLLHVHYAVPHATSAYLARQILGPRAPKIVTTLHGTDITLVGNDPSFLPITRLSILGSDALTTPSAYLRQATYDNFALDATLPIEVIPNFVDTERFRPPKTRTPFALAPLFPRVRGPARVLAHNSNFRSVKRVEDVLAVFARVRQGGPVPSVLVLIGDGPDRPRLEAKAAELGLTEAVAFLGQQRNFVEVLQEADLFLLTSESESFGLAALEAMSCGVPVVATRVGGIPEVVDEGKSGQLLPLGDIEGMARACQRLLSDAALHRRMAEAARATAVARFARAPLVSRYEALYRRLVPS